MFALDFISFLFAIFVIILTPFIWWYICLTKNKSLDKVPGPKPLPVIGNALDLGKTPHDLFENLFKFHAKYGNTFKYYIGASCTLAISDPKSMEYIMNSTTEITKSNGYDLLHTWLGEGLLVSTGEKWRSRRKMITPTFHFKILDQFIDVFNSAGNIFIEKLSKELGNKSVDIYPYVNLCSLDIICETSMGAKINAQEHQNTDYVNTVKEFLALFTHRFFSSWERFDTLFRLSPKYQLQVEYVKKLHDFTNKVIENRRNELRLKNKEVQMVNEEGVKRKVALLDMLLQSENSSRLTNEDLREEIDTFMFEGHDTISSGTSFGMLLLADNPNVQQKVYEEIVDVIGDDLSIPVTMQNLNDMKYLDMTVKEVLRVCPSVPIYERKLCNNCEINGVSVPKGTTINMFIMAMHHNKEYFPDPERFDPERFLPENQALRPNYSYVPFSAGLRNCIGQKFAMLEMKSVLSKVVRNYRLLPVPGFKPELALTAVLKSVNGVHVRLELR